MTQDFVATFAIQVIFYTSIAFIVGVSFVWPWWRDQLGWSIISKTGALVIVLLQPMLIIWLGVNTFTSARWLSWFSVWVLFLVPAALVWRFVIIYRIQRKGASHHPPQPDPKGGP